MDVEKANKRKIALQNFHKLVGIAVRKNIDKQIKSEEYAKNKFVH